MLRALLLTTAACCLLAPHAIAESRSGTNAELAVADGEVLVNQGHGFVPAATGQRLQAGDQVMVGANGGDAVITYDDRCVERIRNNDLEKPVDRERSTRVAVVRVESPCAASASTTTFGLSTNAVLVGGGIAAAVVVGVALSGSLNRQSSP